MEATDYAERCRRRWMLWGTLKLLQRMLNAAVHAQDATEDSGRCREGWTLQRTLDAAKGAQNLQRMLDAMKDA